MTDIEGNTISRQAVHNPYVSPHSGAHANLPGDYLLTILKRLVYVGVSIYGLNHFAFYQVILNSPHVSHEWFKIGLAATIALLGIKAYVEIFEGRINKASVTYSNFPKSTHAAIGLFLLSSFAFHVALWPHYRWNSMLVLGMAFFGIVLQVLLSTPSWLQNIVSFVVLTFFLQVYS